MIIVALVVELHVVAKLTIPGVSIHVNKHRELHPEIVASIFVLLCDIWLCDLLCYEEYVLENLKLFLSSEIYFLPKCKSKAFKYKVELRPKYKYYLACFIVFNTIY